MEEVSYNLAYRWFYDFDLSDKIPNHSLLSQNRRRRFTDSTVFRDIFNQIVRLCVERGIVTGDKVVLDGTFIPSEVSKSSLYELAEMV